MVMVLMCCGGYGVCGMDFYGHLVLFSYREGVQICTFTVGLVYIWCIFGGYLVDTLHVQIVHCIYKLQSI